MLMNYETFKKELREEVIRLLPKEMVAGGYKVEFQSCFIVNEKRETLVIFRNDDSCAPSFNLAQLYECLKVSPIEEVASKVVHDYLLNNNFRVKLGAEAINGMSMENLYLVVVNTAWNLDLLKQAPHRNFLNLSVIYRICITNDTNGISSVLVTNTVMNQLGVSSEEELYQKALANTERLFPFKIEDMRDVLKEMMMSEVENGNLTEYEVDNYLQCRPKEDLFLVLTNNRGINGSSILLYPEYLKRAAEILNCEMVIVLPSSVQEILVKAMPITLYGIEDMVKEINASQVQECERLSDQFYIFDAKSNTLSIAGTDINTEACIGQEYTMKYECKA